MTNLTMSKSNVTLDIGSGNEPDRCQVSVSYQLDLAGKRFSTSTGATVLLPAGSIVKGPLAAEKDARVQAADMLDEVAAFLRKEAAT